MRPEVSNELSPHAPVVSPWIASGLASACRLIPCWLPPHHLPSHSCPPHHLNPNLQHHHCGPQPESWACPRGLPLAPWRLPQPLPAYAFPSSCSTEKKNANHVKPFARNATRAELLASHLEKMAIALLEVRLAVQQWRCRQLSPALAASP